MPNEANIRIIATDGELQKEISFINHQDNSIVIGWVTPGYDIYHFTYHPDGYIHRKRKQGDTTKTEGKAHGPPLDQFEGFYEAFSGGVIDDLSKLAISKEFSIDRQYDSVFYLDTRKADGFLERYDSEKRHFVAIHYSVILVENGFDITKIIEAMDDRPEVRLYTRTDPWIMIVSWPTPLHGRPPLYTNNFQISALEE